MPVDQAGEVLDERVTRRERGAVDEHGDQCGAASKRRGDLVADEVLVPHSSRSCTIVSHNGPISAQQVARLELTVEAWAEEVARPQRGMVVEDAVRECSARSFASERAAGPCRRAGN